MRDSGGGMIVATIGTLSSILLCKYAQSVRRLYEQDKALEESLRKTSEINVYKGQNSVPLPPSDCIYCDYNATTPVYPEVFEAMVPYFTTHFGNPSSSHSYGEIANGAVVQARKLVKEMINASDVDEIYFVSCGSEADNRCVDISLHAFHQRHSRGVGEVPVIVTSSIEHPAILCYLRVLQTRKQIELKVIGVNREGFIDLVEVEESLSPRVALVTIMHSNNEIGTIQPIRAISKVVRRFNRRNNCDILFHSDAAQSVGKVPIDVQQLGVDMLTIVGHKYGAPKGIGALFIAKAVTATPMLVGGSQERGIRAGTENVPYIVGLGEASRLAKATVKETALRLLSLKLKFLRKISALLADKIDWVRFNGPKRSNQIPSLEEDLKMLKVLMKSEGSGSFSANNDTMEQLPNTLSVSFRSLVGHQIVHALKDRVACSTGSACHALPASHESLAYAPSEVLVAVGVDPLFGTGTIRVSFGRFSSEEEVERAAETIAETVLNMWREKTL